MGKRCLFTRLAVLLGAGFWAFQTVSVGAQQGPPGALFAEVPRTVAADTSPGLGEVRSRLVTFSPDRILIPPSSGRTDAPATGAHRLVLNLFDDTTVAAVLERLELGVDNQPTWLGTVEGQPLSSVTLTVGDGVLAGIVQTRGATYALRPAGTGITRIVEIDRQNVRPDGEPVKVPL